MVIKFEDLSFTSEVATKFSVLACTSDTSGVPVCERGVKRKSKFEGYYITDISPEILTLATVKFSNDKFANLTETCFSSGSIHRDDKVISTVLKVPSSAHPFSA